VSPRTAAQNRGIQRERDLKKKLEAEGWFVVRASGSLGDADLLALRAGDTPRLIEVKSTTGPFTGFKPPDRRAVLAAAALAGAEAWLVWMPKGGAVSWIDPSQWPALPQTAEAA
jgi:Holliday junction resolvase